MGFIYKVTNNINGKIYIGQTTFSLEERFQQHLRDCKNKSRKGRPFMYALNKYGKENFTISLIEEVDDSLLNEREQYWIKELHSYIKDPLSCGYNATLGGDSIHKYDYKEIYNYYLKVKSKTKVAKDMNICMQTVTRAIMSNQGETISNCTGREIIRIDPITQKEKIYKSIRQAAEELSLSLQKDMGTIRKRITYIINHCPEQKGYGFYWKVK